MKFCQYVESMRAVNKFTPCDNSDSSAEIYLSSNNYTSYTHLSSSSGARANFSNFWGCRILSDWTKRQMCIRTFYSHELRFDFPYNIKLHYRCYI